MTEADANCPKILAVDPNPDEGELIFYVLAPQFEVVWCANPEQATGFLKKGSFRLVIEADGVHSPNWVDSDEAVFNRYGGTPTILYTNIDCELAGRINDELIEQHREHGVEIVDIGLENLAEAVRNLNSNNDSLKRQLLVA